MAMEDACSIRECNLALIIHTRAQNTRNPDLHQGFGGPLITLHQQHARTESAAPLGCGKERSFTLVRVSGMEGAGFDAQDLHRLVAGVVNAVLSPRRQPDPGVRREGLLLPIEVDCTANPTTERGQKPTSPKLQQQRSGNCSGVALYPSPLRQMYASSTSCPPGSCTTCGGT